VKKTQLPKHCGTKTCFGKKGVLQRGSERGKNVYPSWRMNGWGGKSVTLCYRKRRLIRRGATKTEKGPKVQREGKAEKVESGLGEGRNLEMKRPKGDALYSVPTNQWIQNEKTR